VQSNCFAEDPLAWPARVLIVDDAASTRRFPRAVLEDCPYFDIAGEAASASAGIAAAQRVHPDLVLLDLSMPGMDGPTSVEGLGAAPTATVVILSGMDPEVGAPFLDAGARAFIPKGLPPDELLDRLHDLVGGRAPSQLAEGTRSNARLVVVAIAGLAASARDTETRVAPG